MADNGSDKPKRDVDDISLDDARPARKGSGTSIVLGVVLLILIFAGVWYVAKVQRERREEAARIAKGQEDARQGQLQRVNENLQAAVNANAAGDLSSVISYLKKADDMLGTIISAANEQGNTAAAEEVLQKRAPVSAAVTDIERALEEHLPNISTQFGLQPPSVTPPTPEASTTTVPGAETPLPPTAVPGGEVAPPVTPPAAAPPAAPQAVPPTAPTAPTAPPVPPVPGAAAPAGG